ncbi:MAG TPA: hypothetical protein VNT22_01960 [Baekduia sp.]|nr:hypothetical protein [Baekduia sp.]
MTRLLTLTTILLAGFTAVAMASDRSAAGKGAEWLLRADPDASGTAADAVVALRAGGHLSGSQASARAAQLRSDAPGYATTAGATAKTILGLVATGSGNPRCAGNIDLLNRLVARGSKGRYGKTAWDQSLGMIALKALRRTPPASTARFLLAARGKGGWNFTLSKSGRDDVTHTALAIMGLRAAGVKPSERGLRDGVKWLIKQRTPSGGFAHQRRDRNEANATALAVQALRSVGRTDRRGLAALRALQRGDGAFQFTASDSGSRQLATVDAVVALSGRYLPAATVKRAPQRC